MLAGTAMVEVLTLVVNVVKRVTVTVERPAARASRLIDPRSSSRRVRLERRLTEGLPKTTADRGLITVDSLSKSRLFCVGMHLRVVVLLTVFVDVVTTVDTTVVAFKDVVVTPPVPTVTVVVPLTVRPLGVVVLLITTVVRSTTFSVTGLGVTVTAVVVKVAVTALADDVTQEVTVASTIWVEVDVTATGVMVLPTSTISVDLTVTTLSGCVTRATSVTVVFSIEVLVVGSGVIVVPMSSVNVDFSVIVTSAPVVVVNRVWDDVTV